LLLLGKETRVVHGCLTSERLLSCQCYIILANQVLLHNTTVHSQIKCSDPQAWFLPYPF
jgi:hypothetical protein